MKLRQTAACRLSYCFRAFQDVFYEIERLWKLPITPKCAKLCSFDIHFIPYSSYAEIATSNRPRRSRMPLKLLKNSPKSFSRADFNDDYSLNMIEHSSLR